MNIFGLHGLRVFSVSTPPTKQTSQQDASTSAYATNFFKSLNECARSFVRSLVGRVTDFFKDLRAKFEPDPNVAPLREYFQGLVNKPLNKNDLTDTTQTRLAGLVELINNETLKTNRALANLFYKTRAELLSQILAEGKTEIAATTVDASNGLAALGPVTEVPHTETPQEIIAHDLAQLKARTTAQKICDIFDSNAKTALGLHSKNEEKLKELLRPKHEKAMESLKRLVDNRVNPTDFETEIETIKPEIQEFLKENNPFQKETRDTIGTLYSDLFSNAKSSNDIEYVQIFIKLNKPSSSVNSTEATTTTNLSDDSSHV
jgi:hypothetical protein